MQGTTRHPGGISPGQAVRWRYLASNPCDLVTRPKAESRRMPALGPPAAQGWIATNPLPYTTAIWKKQAPRKSLRGAAFGRAAGI